MGIETVRQHQQSLPRIGGNPVLALIVAGLTVASCSSERPPGGMAQGFRGMPPANLRVMVPPFDETGSPTTIAAAPEAAPTVPKAADRSRRSRPAAVREQSKTVFATGPAALTKSATPATRETTPKAVVAADGAAAGASAARTELPAGETVKAAVAGPPVQIASADTGQSDQDAARALPPLAIALPVPPPPVVVLPATQWLPSAELPPAQATVVHDKGAAAGSPPGHEPKPAPEKAAPRAVATTAVAPAPAPAAEATPATAATPSATPTEPAPIVVAANTAPAAAAMSSAPAKPPPTVPVPAAPAPTAPAADKPAAETYAMAISPSSGQSAVNETYAAQATADDADDPERRDRRLIIMVVGVLLIAVLAAMTWLPRRRRRRSDAALLMGRRGPGARTTPV